MASPYFKKDPFFIGMNQNETLEQFLDRKVRPDTMFLKSCGEVIDTVVRRIHRIPNYSVAHVVKGGSLGKGTGVRGYSDVDLLVVLNNFTDMEDLVENMEDVISSFETHLKSTRHEDVEICRVKNTTPFTLQFEVRCWSKDVWIEVDLLPIVDIFSSGSVSYSLNKVYDIMKRKKDLRKYYAKCVAKVQVEFVKEMPARVKDLIRLFKYWNYTEKINMSSFSLELIIIYVWRQNGSPNKFKMNELIYDVVQILEDFSTTEIAFGTYYNPGEYINYLNIEPPYVLDPANPFHNVVKAGWFPINLYTFHGESLGDVTVQGESLGDVTVQGFKSSGALSDCVFHSYKQKENEGVDISLIERKGRNLMRKFANLPEESPVSETTKKEKKSSSTLSKVVTFGLAAGALFALGTFAASKLTEKSNDSDEEK